MKKSLLIGLSLAYVLPMAAQSLPDSTDMFFRHLELKEVTVTGAVGDMKMKETSSEGWATTALWSSTMAFVRKASNGAMNTALKSMPTRSARWKS